MGEEEDETEGVIKGHDAVTSKKAGRDERSVDCKAYWRKGRQTRGCRALISGGGGGGHGGGEKVMILRVKKGRWMDVERQGGKAECRKVMKRV